MGSFAKFDHAKQFVCCIWDCLGLRHLLFLYQNTFDLSRQRNISSIRYYYDRSPNAAFGPTAIFLVPMSRYPSASLAGIVTYGTKNVQLEGSGGGQNGPSLLVKCPIQRHTSRRIEKLTCPRRRISPRQRNLPSPGRIGLDKGRPECHNTSGRSSGSTVLRLGSCLVECLLSIIVVWMLLLLHWSLARHKPTPVRVECRTTKPVRPAKCPYCEFTFEKRPQRNRKCPQCGSRIMLRKGRLLIETQAEVFDKKRLEQIAANLNRLRRRNLIEEGRLGVCRYVELSCADDGITCDACRGLHGKRVLIRDELRNPTLPVKNCTSDFCRCCYRPALE
jgi:hypothetical protein